MRLHFQTLPEIILNINTEQAKPDIVGNLTYGRRLFNKKFGFIISASYRDTYQGTISKQNNPGFDINTNNFDYATSQYNRILIFH